VNFFVEGFRSTLKGGPVDSKREDRLLDHFFGSGTKDLFGSFFIPALPLQFR